LRPFRRSVVVPLSVVALLSACSSGGSSNEQTLTVLGAASLTDAFQAIGTAFERVHDGVRVRFSFGPSDGLAQQIQEGARADVFASASATWMDAVADRPGISGRSDFARNRLTLVVPSSNPARIRKLDELTHPGVKLVLAAPGVPAGDYAHQILANAGIAGPALANVVSNEIDVKGVLAKVASGDADAGIVYVTDLTPDVADRIESVDIPDSVNVIATYPIAVVDGGSDPALARSFVRFVLGPGQGTLRRAGFLPAP
jgi:molybdate transport system substrate-binding protein